jgi:hypothetical protein
MQRLGSQNGGPSSEPALGQPGRPPKGWRGMRRAIASKAFRLTRQLIRAVTGGPQKVQEPYAAGLRDDRPGTSNDLASWRGTLSGDKIPGRGREVQIVLENDVNTNHLVLTLRCLTQQHTLLEIQVYLLKFQENPSKAQMAFNSKSEEFDWWIIRFEDYTQMLEFQAWIAPVALKRKRQEAPHPQAAVDSGSDSSSKQRHYEEKERHCEESRCQEKRSQTGVATAVAESSRLSVFHCHLCRMGGTGDPARIRATVERDTPGRHTMRIYRASVVGRSMMAQRVESLHFTDRVNGNRLRKAVVFTPRHGNEDAKWWLLNFDSLYDALRFQDAVGFQSPGHRRP